MDTDALRWFQLVADGATVTDVAELELRSQPSVSRALARLEKEVGAELFRRSGRVLALTRAGDAFRRHVDAALHSLDDGLAAVQQVTSPETGIVSVAFQASLGTWLVPDLVGSFRDRYPEVEFDLRSKSDEHVSAVGSRGSADFELSMLRVTDGSGGDRVEDVVWRPLAREPLRLLVPQGHPLSRQQSASLADVADDAFIALTPTSLLRTQVDQLCARAGVQPRISLTADDLPTLRGYVASGLGVGVVPARWEAGATEPVSPRVHYLELADPDAERNIGLSWNGRRRLLPAAELFREHVLARARAGELPRPAPVSRRVREDTPRPPRAQSDRPSPRG